LHAGDAAAIGRFLVDVDRLRAGRLEGDSRALANPLVTGAFQRRSPVGALANGTPRKWFTPSIVSPTRTPVSMVALTEAGLAGVVCAMADEVISAAEAASAATQLSAAKLRFMTVSP
jgi:hypothetical protein